MIRFSEKTTKNKNENIKTTVSGRSQLEAEHRCFSNNFCLLVLLISLNLGMILEERIPFSTNHIKINIFPGLHHLLYETLNYQLL